MLATSPRLNSILTTLLASDAPVSVDTLAKTLATSRRTVFRELENVDRLLKKCGLSLDTKIGEGMLLQGTAQQKQQLADLLAGGAPTQHSKQSRKTLLALMLLEADEMQKLYYFAKPLGVSEATISLDMDLLQQELLAWRLRLVRRPGQGVELLGSEEDKRRAFVDAILQAESPEAFAKAFGRPAKQVCRGVQQLLNEEWLPKLLWMTDESMQVLLAEIIVMVERVRTHHTLTAEPEQVSGLLRELSTQLCDSIENHFTLSLSPTERSALGFSIRGCRAKQLNMLDINDDAAYSYAQILAYRMIDSFDPALSQSLKLNEDLVRGLSLHLWSAVVRLQKGITLPALMRSQLEEKFPTMFQKCRQAARVLQQELNTPVPDSEIAFIASHFGAALMHLGERSSHHVVLKAGIVCVAGIGVSYMMASQVRSRFSKQLEVTISDWNSPETWGEFDLLISSIPLDYSGCPVVQVQPFLTDDDFAAIGSAIGAHTVMQPDRMPRLAGSLPDRMDKAAVRLAEISRMLKGFSRLCIHADCTFDELAKLTGYRFGTQPESGSQIYTDLLRRESVSTQVVPQLGIVLLHSRSGGASVPALGLVCPEGGRFTDAYFAGARGCLVMLLPKDSGKDFAEVFGTISGALIEDDVLLGAVQSGVEAVAYTRIEAALLQYLQQYWNKHFA